jgi:hypothetical protein
MYRIPIGMYLNSHPKLNKFSIPYKAKCIRLNLDIKTLGNNLSGAKVDYAFLVTDSKGKILSKDPQGELGKSSHSIEGKSTSPFFRNHSFSIPDSSFPPFKVEVFSLLEPNDSNQIELLSCDILGFDSYFNLTRLREKVFLYLLKGVTKLLSRGSTGRLRAVNIYLESLRNSIDEAISQINKESSYPTQKQHFRKITMDCFSKGENGSV